MITHLDLREWQALGPADSDLLAGLELDSAARETAAALSQKKMLLITELRRGVEVEATSFVGRVRLGDLSISVRPKVEGRTLLSLLRYAYGWRKLRLLSESSFSTNPFGFEDLLIHQLNAEAQELISRGLQKKYVSTSERLASPRGRIDVARLARDGGLKTATLPCRHHPRVEDTLHNQVLKAGLHFAAAITTSVELSRDSNRLALRLDEPVSSRPLNWPLLDRADRAMNRMTLAYVPALSIIRILLQSQGVTLDHDASRVSVPGFLFDMNAFFEALIGRFLTDNLRGYTVQTQHRLAGMFRFAPGYPGARALASTPRPDFAVIDANGRSTLLDAKYRDLWVRELPRDMLYQLVVYAMSQPDSPRATILYPSDSSTARESRIDIFSPVTVRPRKRISQSLGQVVLRPVSLARLQSLIEGSHTARAAQERQEYACWMVFGESSTSQ